MPTLLTSPRNNISFFPVATLKLKWLADSKIITHKKINKLATINSILKNLTTNLCNRKKKKINFYSLPST